MSEQRTLGRQPALPAAPDQRQSFSPRPRTGERFLAYVRNTRDQVFLEDRDHRTSAGLWALALFMWAGDIKGSPLISVIPIDFTLLMGMAVIGVSVWKVATRERTVQVVTLTPMVVIIAGVPSLLWASLSTYGANKAVNFLVLGSIALIGTSVLVHSGRDIRGLLRRVAIIHVYISGAALMRGPIPEVNNRLAGFANDTIVLGRGAGMLTLFCAAAALRSKRGVRAFWIGAAMIAAYTVIGSGSRGPALMVLFAAPLLLARGQLVGHRRAQQRSRFVGVILAVIVLLLSFSLAPEGATSRFGENRESRSSSLRTDSYQKSLSYVISHPVGVGFGDFADVVDTFGEFERQYPHNLLLEIGVEQGWVPLFLMIAVIVSALRTLWRLRFSPDHRLLLTLLTYFMLNCLVSGDLNDNRQIISLLGFAFSSRVLLNRLDRARLQHQTNPAPDVYRLSTARL
jgi:O-antigen ligase